MSPSTRLAVCLILPFTVLLATPAAAQVLVIDSGNVRRGASVDIPVRFDAGPVSVVGFNMRVVYDRTRFNPPTCVAHHGAICFVNHSLGHVSLIHVDFNLAPIASARYMTVRFPVPRTAPRGSSPLGAREIAFANADADPVAGTIYTGTIQIR